MNTKKKKNNCKEAAHADEVLCLKLTFSALKISMSVVSEFRLLPNKNRKKKQNENAE